MKWTKDYDWNGLCDMANDVGEIMDGSEFNDVPEDFEGLFRVVVTYIEDGEGEKT